MAKPYGEETHTQTSITVCVTVEEKQTIKRIAGKKGMSKYLLDLHKSHLRALWRDLMLCLR